MKPLLGRPIVHQAVEYAVGFALASAAIRSHDRAILVVAGALVIASTAIFDGPLAAFPRVSRRAHRIVDITLALIGTGIAFSMTMEVASRLSLVAAALVLAFMSVRFTHVIRETGS